MKMSTYTYDTLPMNTCSGPFEKKPFMKLEGEWLNVIYSKTPGGVSHCTLALVHLYVRTKGVQL